MEKKVHLLMRGWQKIAASSQAVGARNVRKKIPPFRAAAVCSRVFFHNRVALSPSANLSLPKFKNSAGNTYSTCVIIFAILLNDCLSRI
jgi:hypothetical protein